MQHVNIKIYAGNGEGVDPAAAIPVFHRWIQTGAAPELLIDVADYSHVPAGPGVMLIGHEANYSLDCGQNRLGLLYNRKAAASTGDAGEALGQAYSAAVAACQRLEREPEFGGRLNFDAGQVEVILNDRLLHPNTEEGWQAVRPEFERFFNGVFGQGGYAIERMGEARERLRVSVRKR
jgi:hypothetical protein